MKPIIKVTSFHRTYPNSGSQIVQSYTSQISVNFIIYTPNKKLSFAQKLIKQKQKQRDDISLNRCLKITALTYALSCAPAGIPTYCIFDSQIDQQIMKTFMQNSNAIQNKQFYRLALYLQNIQNLHKKYFSIKGLDLITSQQQKIIQFIENTLQKRKRLLSKVSTSSINSKDFDETANKFKENNQMKQISSPDKSEKLNEQLYVQSTPGYKYNQPQLWQKKGVKFDHVNKRSKPQQWTHTQSTFKRMQAKQ